MFGILLLILINLVIGYAFAVYLHRPDLLAVPWGFLPGDATSLDDSMLTSAALTLSPAARPSSAIPEKPFADSPVDSVENAAVLDNPSEVQHRPVQDAVLAFKAELNRYCSELGSLDEQMRDQSEAPNSQEVQKCVEQFQTLSDRYLQQQERSVQVLREQAEGSSAEFAGPCLAVAEQHTAAVAATRAEVSDAAGLADAAAACRAFLLSTHRLADANQSLQQELDLSLDRMVEQQNSAEAVEDDSPATATSEPDTGQTESLERAIAEFVRIQASPGGKFSVALIEIDQITSVNRKHGRPVSDRMLDAIVKTFVALSPRSTVANDPQRQQFLYFQGDTSARETTNGVEQVRQRIEAATFQHGNNAIRVTLSGGVAEASYEEEPTEIIKRLQEMLREARRYGRNRTFFQEGQQSAPAIPAVVQVEKRVIEI